ncbi:hypothetical protein NC651_036944 [Populus alba x Populus x berolinensis]|nr:hypothetical protein NC651_036944 [Populus alba x Populus x berolinensis]
MRLLQVQGRRRCGGCSLYGWLVSKKIRERARERELLGLRGKKAKNPKKSDCGFYWQGGCQVFLFR